MVSVDSVLKTGRNVVEQDIKSSVTIADGATGSVSIPIPSTEYVWVRGLGYDFSSGTTYQLVTGKTSFPSRTDQEGSIAQPAFYSYPLPCKSGGNLQLLITNNTGGSLTYSVRFIILTTRILDFNSDGGAIVVPVQQASGTLNNVVINNAAGTQTAGVDASGNLQVVETNLNNAVVAEGAAATEGIQISLDDGTDTQFAQCDASGNLKTIDQIGGRTAAHSAVTVAATSTSILAANASRKGALFINDSDETIYIKIEGSAAVLNEGIRLNASGGSYEMSDRYGNLEDSQVFAISTSGSKTILVTEFT